MSSESTLITNLRSGVSLAVYCYFPGHIIFYLFCIGVHSSAGTSAALGMDKDNTNDLFLSPSHRSNLAGQLTIYQSAYLALVGSMFWTNSQAVRDDDNNRGRVRNLKIPCFIN